MLSRLKVVFATVLLLGVSGAVIAEDSGLPPKDSLPPTAIPQSLENPKSLVIRFHITESDVAVRDVIVKYGRTRTYIADPDQFRFELKGFLGESLARIQTYDPRGIRIYSSVNDPEFGEIFKENYTRKSEADSQIAIPLVPKLSSIQLGDSWNYFYGTFYIAREIKSFCADKTSDGECKQWLADLAEEDKTPPTVSCGSSDGIWHATDIAIGCTASDSGSGLANPEDASFSLSTTLASDTETDNALTISRNICDVADNCTSAGPIGGNKIDKKAPAITIVIPVAGASYIINQVVMANYSCTDGGSGVAMCIGPVATEAAIDTAAVGSKTFTVNTADNVGNSGLTNVTYNVIYNFSGFFPPVDNPLNRAKAGSAIPVKFSLSGNQGMAIFEANYPASQSIACESAAPTGALEKTNTAGNSGLNYDPATDTYNYIWKTDKAWAGTCRQLIVKLIDGTFHLALFKFMK